MEDIRAERRLMLGWDRPITGPMQLPGTSPEDKQRRWLDGALVIVSHHTLKEYIAGLKRGCTDRLKLGDRAEQLAKELVQRRPHLDVPPAPIPPQPPMLLVSFMNHLRPPGEVGPRPCSASQAVGPVNDRLLVRSVPCANPGSAFDASRGCRFQ